MNATAPGASPIKVSVAMITYNHEQYVSGAIESILEQEVRFPLELVIGEDCSTDATRTIVQQYARRYPDRIRLLLHDRNIGMVHNFVTTIRSCSGDYIALCEGDDFWTDNQKLLKQCIFLDTHPDCSLCLHDVQALDESRSRPPFRIRPLEQKSVYKLEDALSSTSTLSQTSSAVFRRTSLPDFPEWYFTVPLPDWALYILLAEKGDIGYVDGCMSTYRMHPGGVWSRLSQIERLQQRLQMYDTLDAYFNYCYTTAFESGRIGCQYILCLDQWLRGSHAPHNAWVELLAMAFERVADSFFWEVLGATLAVQRAHGYQQAEAAVNWTCGHVGSLPGGRAWCHRLRGDWYAGAAFQSYAARDLQHVRPASWQAISHNWRQVTNYGLLKRWALSFVED